MESPNLPFRIKCASTYQTARPAHWTYYLEFMPFEECPKLLERQIFEWLWSFKRNNFRNVHNYLAKWHMVAIRNFPTNGITYVNRPQCSIKATINPLRILTLTVDFACKMWESSNICITKVFSRISRRSRKQSWKPCLENKEVWNQLENHYWKYWRLKHYQSNHDIHKNHLIFFSALDQIF